MPLKVEILPLLVRGLRAGARDRLGQYGAVRRCRRCADSTRMSTGITAGLSRGTGAPTLGSVLILGGGATAASAARGRGPARCAHRLRWRARSRVARPAWSTSVARRASTCSVRTLDDLRRRSTSALDAVISTLPERAAAVSVDSTRTSIRTADAVRCCLLAVADAARRRVAGRQGDRRPRDAACCRRSPRCASSSGDDERHHARARGRGAAAMLAPSACERRG